MVPIRGETAGSTLRQTPPGVLPPSPSLRLGEEKMYGRFVKRIRSMRKYGTPPGVARRWLIYRDENDLYALTTSSNLAYFSLAAVI